MFAIPKEDCDHKLVIHVTVPQTVAELMLCQRHQTDLKTSMQASNPQKQIRTYLKFQKSPWIA